MSVYEAEETFAGYGLAMVEGFVASLESAAAAALTPSRALLDASLARPIATNLDAIFGRVGVLFQGTLTEKRTIERDTNTRPDVLRARWATFAEETIDRVNQTQKAIPSAGIELETALVSEALPVSDDPAAVLVARGEIELALSVGTNSPFETMLRLAGRGGDIAAACASEYGRLLLARAQEGDPFGFDVIRAESIRTVLDGADEGRRRAAVALQALETPAPGRTVGALAEANVFAVQVLDIVRHACETGLVLA